MRELRQHAIRSRSLCQKTLWRISCATQVCPFWLWALHSDQKWRPTTTCWKKNRSLYVASTSIIQLFPQQSSLVPFWEPDSQCYCAVYYLADTRDVRHTHIIVTCNLTPKMVDHGHSSCVCRRCKGSNLTTCVCAITTHQSTMGDF